VHLVGFITKQSYHQGSVMTQILQPSQISRRVKFKTNAVTHRKELSHYNARTKRLPTLCLGGTM